MRPRMLPILSMGAVLAAVGSLGGNIVNALAPPSAPPEGVKKKRPAARPRRVKVYSGPNSVHGGVQHSGVAFIYPQTREKARRVRQHEALFQKALDRLGPVDGAAEFG